MASVKVVDVVNTSLGGLYMEHNNAINVLLHCIFKTILLEDVAFQFHNNRFVKAYTIISVQ